MVEGLYVLLGLRCPLVPHLYRQQAVCEQEGVPFQSKIELMEATIRSFEPVAGTRTSCWIVGIAPKAFGVRPESGALRSPRA